MYLFTNNNILNYYTLRKAQMKAYISPRGYNLILLCKGITSAEFLYCIYIYEIKVLSLDILFKRSISKKLCLMV